MSWIFEQVTGKLYSPAGTYIATGYAGGNCGKNPEGVNNPLEETTPCVGPLPAGLYQFGTPENSAHLGPFAIPLVPDGSNQMFGRGSFFVHGDTSAMNQSASEGCMIFGRIVREALASSPDQQVQVVANYVPPVSSV